MKKKIIVGIIFLTFSVFIFADRYSDLELFAQVLNHVEKHYFKPISSKKIIYSAIRGLLRDIDPHSYFFTPENFSQFKNQTKGQAYGLGIELDRREGFLVILSVIKNSSAMKAGLKRGDKLIEVNGEVVKNLTVDEFFQKFKKRKKYQLKVLRLDHSKPLSVQVFPGKITKNSVDYKSINSESLYIRIFQFTETTFLELNKIFNKNRSKRVLLDLRGNPGGPLEQAIKVADLFLNEGLIVQVKIRGNRELKTFKAKALDTLPFFPLVVLIDEYSASASEVLAGALKDSRRALIVGRKSFGKGSIQSLFPLKKKYGLKLTVGEYKTPLGHSIQNHGVKPHIQIKKDSKSPFIHKITVKDSDVKQALYHLENFKKSSRKFFK